MWRPNYWNAENIRLVVFLNTRFAPGISQVNATDIDMIEAGADAMHEAIRLSGMYGTRIELAQFLVQECHIAEQEGDTAYLEQKGWLCWFKDENPDSTCQYCGKELHEENVCPTYEAYLADKRSNGDTTQGS